ncbi:MAG: DNA primase [Gammaproteobacteria bacterium]|nr:DNA primase [Gammaproteobacteria bacterium]
MARYFPKSFVADLISRVDIVEVIGKSINLKKNGSRYKALCPFHDEKTPSFIVTPEKGIYYCFGCSENGNAIDFLIKFENLSFPEAIEALSEIVGLQLPENSKYKEDNHKYLFQAISKANEIYKLNLNKNNDASNYLKNRGINKFSIDRYELGFSPNSWDSLRKSALKKDYENYNQSGLMIKNEKGHYYDRFRNRIMFPIKNISGKIIGFGGRIISNEQPKYLNSPETNIFRKANELYGLYEAKNKKGNIDKIIVVEGYIDVISLTQNGIESVVATMGTAITNSHIKKLKRFSEKIIFCFDGDKAGRAAAWRALETLLLSAGGTIEFKFLILPEGSDPDSIITQEGKSNFENLIEKSMSLTEFLFSELEEKIELNNTDNLSKLVSLVKPLLEKVSNPIYKELIINKLSQKINIKTEKLSNLLEEKNIERKVDAPIPQNLSKNTLIRKAITLILHYPSAARELKTVPNLSDIDLPGIRLLENLIYISRKNKNYNTANLEEHFREDNEGKFLSKLIGEKPLDNKNAAPLVLSDSIKRIIENDLRNKLSNLMNKGSKLTNEEKLKINDIQEKIKSFF